MAETDRKSARAPVAAPRLSRDLLHLGLIFLLALALRGVHSWGQWHSNPLFLAPNMDELKHHEWAQRIAAGEGLGQSPFFRAPLYYLGLAGLYAIAGPNIPLARALGCLLGALTCVLIAHLGTTLASPRAGLIAGLLAATYWPFIHADQLLLSVGLETFLATLLVILLIAALRRPDWRHFVATGAVWGLSVITRPTFLTWAPLIALWALFGGDRSLWPSGRAGEVARRGGLRDPLAIRLRNAGLVALAAAAVIAPVTLYNRVAGGEWVLVATNGGVNFFIGNNPKSDGTSAAVPGTRTDWDGGYEDTHAIAQRELGARWGRPLTEGEVSAFWYRKGRAWIASEPGDALRLAFRKLARFWAPVEIPNNNPVWFFARRSPLAPLYWIGFPVIAVLGVAGLTLLPRGAWRRWAIPVAFGVTGMLTVVAFFVVDRYRMPMVPILILAAGAGLARVPELWKSRRRLRLGGALVAALAMIGVELLCRPGGAFWPDGRFFRAQEEAHGERVLGADCLRLARDQPAKVVEGLKHYRAAARALPMSPDLQFSLGLALLRSGLPDAVKEAGRPLEASLLMRPSFAEARRFYAEWLVGQGREEEAIEQYRQVVQLQPWGEAYQTALLGLGILLMERDRFEEAARWLEIAVRNDPKDPFAAECLLSATRGMRGAGREAAPPVPTARQ